ncbi:hypothetical protein [Haloarcula sp. CBA1127]|uniref:hypothetical protein n=1 Tax=Haloarcula sp. CBA1127 TaxID=1765055 RepID=UPI000AA676F5|nr:hypothetical protein [Haloarcula sp. CBA1127]
MDISHQDVFWGLAAVFLLFGGGWFLFANRLLLAASMVLNGFIAVVAWWYTRGQPVQV